MSLTRAGKCVAARKLPLQMEVDFVGILESIKNPLDKLLILRELRVGHSELPN